MEKPLTRQEELFCLYSAARYSPKEAAARAGYKNPETAGLRLLSRPHIAERVGALCQKHIDRKEIEAALRRLAFGGIGDVIRLITAPDVAELEFDKMDLLQISELKYSKNCVEVKLYDRIKALQALVQLAETAAEGGEGGFFEALNKTAGRLGEANEI